LILGCTLFIPFHGQCRHPSKPAELHRFDGGARDDDDRSLGPWIFMRAISKCASIYPNNLACTPLAHPVAAGQVLDRLPTPRGL